MFTLRNDFIYVVLFFAMCGFGFVQSAHAAAVGSVTGAPLPGPTCVSGTSSYLSVNFGACLPSNKDGSGKWPNQGRAYWPAGQPLNTAGNAYPMTTGFTTSYVPISGEYKMRTHWCFSSKGSDNTSPPCTLSASVQTVDSIKSVYLTPTQSVASQNPNFGGGNGGTLSQEGNMCMTFVSPDGHEYKTTAARTCQDAQALPDVPSVCAINGTNALNVDMGTLERSKIGTSSSSSTYNVNKSVPVNCAGDTKITLATTFEFTSLTIAGSEVIKTSTPGLGIAIYYDNKAVDQSSSFTNTYEPGTTDINLKFVAVRDPTMNLKDIATGNFTATAIMVMTEN